MLPSKPKLAYIMSRFPHLPETFILREMNELEQLGWQIELYPLIVQEQSVVHAEAQRWIPRAHKIPFLSLAIVRENIRLLFRRPALFLRTLGRSVWGNRTSLKFLLRAILLFPKAVYAANQMQAQGIRHIHAHYATHPALVAWIIHQLTGIQYSITVHAHDIFVCTVMLETKLQDAAFIVAISEYNRSYLTGIVGSWVSDKTYLVHCGIQPDRFQAHRLERDTARFEIMSIGSLQPYKGFPYLIWACAQLRDRSIPFHCRIIGGGELQASLKSLINRSKLEGQVALLGPLPQEEVSRLLPTADCYVQPSIITPSGKMEGIPVSIMEALACALPVVATSISGIPELVRQEETGYLVPPANEYALADALIRVYNEPDRAAQLGEAGRQVVLKEFELSKNVEELAGLFERFTVGLNQ